MATERKKGCGCLVVGWFLVIVGGAGYLLGKGGMMMGNIPFSDNTFVLVGFALGFGLCCIIIGSIWVKIRQLIGNMFGRNRNATSTRPSSTNTRSERGGIRLPGGIELPGGIGLPGSGNQRQQSSDNSTRTRSSRLPQQPTQGRRNGESATGIPNPWIVDDK